MIRKTEGCRGAKSSERGCGEEAAGIAKWNPAGNSFGESREANNKPILRKG